MPIRLGGRLATRASTWPRDHFWRSTRAPRRSWPTMWNEFLPISMPITATLLLSFWDMACSFVFGAPSPACRAGRAGARPDHPILGLQVLPPENDEAWDEASLRERVAAYLDQVDAIVLCANQYCGTSPRDQNGGFVSLQVQKAKE